MSMDVKAKLSELRNALADLPLADRTDDHIVRVALVASEFVRVISVSIRRSLIDYQILYPVHGIEVSPVNVRVTFDGAMIRDMFAVFPNPSPFFDRTGETDFGVQHLRPEDLI